MKVGQAAEESCKCCPKHREDRKHSVVHHRDLPRLIPATPRFISSSRCLIFFTGKDVTGPFEMQEQIRSVMQNWVEFWGEAVILPISVTLYLISTGLQSTHLSSGGFPTSGRRGWWMVISKNNLLSQFMYQMSRKWHKLWTLRERIWMESLKFWQNNY